MLHINCPDYNHMEKLFIQPHNHLLWHTMDSSLNNCSILNSQS